MNNDKSRCNLGGSVFTEFEIGITALEAAGCTSGGVSGMPMSNSLAQGDPSFLKIL